MKTNAVMTREIVVVSPSVSATAAWLRMSQHGVRHLPVVEDGRLVGILSDRDVLRRDADGASPTCAEVMTPAPVTCRADTSVSQVARFMLEHRIDSVPVVDAHGRLIGLVTSRDLLQLLVERDSAQLLPSFDFRMRLVDSDEALAAT